jgi:hypothetical protein
LTSKDWAAYSCELPPRPFGKTSALTSLYHVTHSHTAVRIIDDGRISRGLVYDESRLNVTRRTVVWVSPNIWHYGSRYGTVQFEFDWAKLVAGKTLYWVEAMTEYSPPAVRFFLTREDVSDLPGIVPYDPVRHNGPLHYDGEKWWWNGSYTAEIMVDDHLSLGDCTKIDFVAHHNQYCNIGHHQCTERGKDGNDSAMRVMAHILASQRETVNHALKRDDGSLSGPAERALVLIGMSLRSRKGPDGPVRKSSEVTAVMKAAMSQIAIGRMNDAKKLASLLKSESLIWACLQELCKDHFDVESSSIAEAL